MPTRTCASGHDSIQKCTGVFYPGAIFIAFANWFYPTKLYIHRKRQF